MLDRSRMQAVRTAAASLALIAAGCGSGSSPAGPSEPGGSFTNEFPSGIIQIGNGQDVEVRQRGEGNISVVVQSGYN